MTNYKTFLIIEKNETFKILKYGISDVTDYFKNCKSIVDIEKEIDKSIIESENEVLDNAPSGNVY